MNIFTAELGIVTIHYLIMAYHSEEKRRTYHLSVSFFGGSYFICRIMLMINYILGLDPHSYVYIWATFFVLIGFASFMYSVEKFIYSKFKLVPTTIILILAALTLILPEFNGINLVTLWAFVGGAFGILIPFLYLNLGMKSIGKLKKISNIIGSGTIIFMLGKGMNIVILQEIFPILFIIAPVLMIIGMIIFHIGMINIYLKYKNELLPVVFEFYKNKHFCVVHKGPIKNKLFLCPTCSVFYCEKCLTALIKIENKCWYCDTPLDETKEIKESELQEEMKPEDIVESVAKKKQK
jgi:hypothetical protein